jgi:hypothetical protein
VWQIGEELSQTDRESSSGNSYTFGWVKSTRPSPTQPEPWAKEGVVEFSDYPDEFVMIEQKRFDQGYVGRTTNFHLVGNDTYPYPVSPLAADYQGSRSGDWESDLQPGLVLTAEPELQEHRRGHWQLATEAEINADRGAVWTLVWRIRWRMDRSGYAHLSVFRNGQLVRKVDTGSIKTAYDGQQPRVYCWLGGYTSGGVSSAARVTQSLDYRGHTVAEALADRPELGSTKHSFSTGGSSDSWVNSAGSVTVPDGAIRASG